MTPVLDVVIFQVSTTFGARRLHRSAFAKLFQGLSGSEGRGGFKKKNQIWLPTYLYI